MQNEWWMRPALQKSEAVLLPALERRTLSHPKFAHRFAHAKSSDEPFLPVTEPWSTSETRALSTYVRPRGSMAGRGVLRAAGIHATPYGISSRPQYASASRLLQRTAKRRFR